ncbi:hypothetical protein ACFL0L_03305 [Patescibacteria group bacterium]
MKNTESQIINSSKGFTIIQLIIWAVVVSVVVGGFFYLLNSERSKTRDAKRMSDMTRVQAAFELLYSTTASYSAAAEGCYEEETLVSTCALSTQLPDISIIRDPGNFLYTVTKVPDDEGYEVTFELERSYGNLQAGVHTVTQSGIR